jgi:GH15 family glucan-1,4-alpha-glucosidase
VLEHLEGYRRSRPVRIGNAAATQEQLDIYGEVLRAAYLHYRRDPGCPGSTPTPDKDAWRLLCYLVDEAAAHWQEAGRGMWEMRSEPRHFLYGKLMCWAALDAGIRLAHDHHLAAPLDRWERTREAIRAAILDKGFDRRLGAFTQAFGSSTLDATALVIPRSGFLPPTDTRVLSTIEQIQSRLMQDGLIYRYRTSDGLPDDEGTFTLCTFWLVDALALANRVDEARSLFEQMLARANDVGLFAEEIDRSSGQQLGNFPQGFSHMALIGAAVNLARAQAATTRPAQG